MERVGTLLVVLALTGLSQADVINYTSQSRTVGGGAGSACENGVSDSVAASDFGPFTETITVAGDFASTQATQSSVLCGTSIHAQGSTSAGGAGCVGTAYAGGYSDFSVVFELDESRSYSLQASFGNYASYSISGPSLNLSAGGFKKIVNDTLDLDGTLAVGTYTITLDANSNSVFDLFDNGSFDFVLRLEGDPDLDGSGSVDGTDLGLLLAQWGPCATCCPADLNADGMVDAADLGLLLGAWTP